MTTAPRRRDARENRTGLLESAAQTLSRDPHASLDQIARGAGLSRRALYGHFDDRESLLREVIAVGAQRFNAMAADAEITDAPSTLARLAMDLWRAASHVRAAAALALDDAHVHATAEALRPVRERLATIIDRGRRDGAFRSDLSPDALSRMIEEAARGTVAALDPEDPAAAADAARIVLGVAGLSWREADDVLARLTPNALSDSPSESEPT